MEKKKLVRLILLLSFLIFVVVLYVIARVYFPKEIQRFPFYGILLLVDLYLWTSIRRKLKDLKPFTRHFIRVAYWLPLLMFLVTVILSMILPVLKWQPALFTYIMGIVLAVYFSKLFAVVFFLLADILKIIHFSIKFARSKKKKIPFRQEAERISRAKFLENLGLAGGGILLSGMLVGIVKWAYDFRVRRETISIPHLPSLFRGFRIVQISDLHLGSWATGKPLEEAVDMINDLDADVVFFTGDLVNFTTDEAFKFREILKRVRARSGVYSILGNHDYGDYIHWDTPEDKQRNMEQLYDFYESIGWKLLRNQHEVISRRDQQIALLGVENWSRYKRFPRYGNLKDAIKGTEDIPFTILLSHDPTHWENEVSKKYPQIDLTLSGHTHGFQFGVEFRNFRWSLAKMMYKYWAGLYDNGNEVRKQYLYVNRGLGMIGYPGRVGILPEITLITLEG